MKKISSGFNKTIDRIADFIILIFEKVIWVIKKIFSTLKSLVYGLADYVLRRPMKSKTGESSHHHTPPVKKWRILMDIILGFLILAFIGTAVLIIWAVSLRTPSLDSFDNRLLGQSAKIYDRTGTILLYDLSQKIRRTVVSFDKISPYIKNATIAIEDETFYQHSGIRATSIIRAVLANLLTLKFSQGGSTITQQVVKNSLLTNDKSISRKIKEWILAIKLEQVTDKDTILNMYLNDSPYGGSIYGVGEATEQFFGKKSSDVTLAEAAYIAALPQSPTTLSPYGKNTERLKERQRSILRKMLEGGFINQDEYDKAIAEQVAFLPRNVTGLKAPHFVMYVKEYLETKYGEDMLQNGGLKVITTLDYDLEQKAEEIVQKYVVSNEKKFKASNGSIVAVDPKTGQILVMVGSRDYFDKAIDGNYNVATARRQPGSAFKPFVYATAFNQGFLPETPVFDTATEFNTSCGVNGQPLPGSPNATCYHPQNYEGGYKGLMSFRTALGASRNIPAVKALYMVGIDNAIKTARSMGVEGLVGADRYGLSLALGGGEVSLLDMTAAFGVFANDGERAPITPILSIQTSDGQEIESYEKSKSTQQVIPQQTARLINDILSDKYARNSIFTLNYTGDRQVAIKTGTTNNSRDAWTIGYTPSISIGAWMGNDDNTPMAQIASALIVSPMWKQFLDYTLKKVPVETFDTPEPASSDIKPFIRGVWVGPYNEVHSELYWIDKNNPLGPPPANPNSDPMFRLWEFGVNGWAQSPGAVGIVPIQQAPSSTPPSGSGGYTGEMSVGLDAGAFVNRNSRVTALVSNYPPTTSRVEYYINGQNIGFSSQAPFGVAFTPAQVPGIQDENDLKAVAFDVLGSTKEAKGYFGVGN